MAYNIKYRQIKAFLTLAETGSLKLAAAHMALTQPSVLNMVKELEECVGTALINRSAQNLELTEAGQDFYDQTKGSIAQLEKAYAFAKSAGKAEHGRVRVVALPSVAGSLLSAIIAEFHKNYPNVAIELAERRYANFMRALRQQEVDFGIGVLRGDEPEFDFTPLFTDQLVVVAPKGHPIASKPIDLETLSQTLGQYKTIIISAGPQPEVLKLLGLGGTSQVLVEQPSTAIEIVRKGTGLTVTLSSALVGLDKHGLDIAPIPGALSYRNIGILVGKDKKLSPPALRFLDCVRAYSSAL
jgi:DNA-binding transcriptional LysR family regulator